MVTRSAALRACNPRLAARADTPRPAADPRLKRTARIRRQPASYQRHSATCNAFPDRRAACSTHRHGIGPLINGSPGLCRGGRLDGTG